MEFVIDLSYGAWSYNFIIIIVIIIIVVITICPSVTNADGKSVDIFKTHTCLVFEVLTAVAMKSSVSWDITPCSPVKMSQRFGGTCYLNLQGRRISHARNQRKAGSRSQLHKIKALCSIETSVDFQRTTGRYIPEDINILNIC
jgi:hypothetical protein